MKQIIREGVFETNSSSTHSICIAVDDSLLNEPDFVHFKLGEFGWDRDRLDTIEAKASYLYTAIADNYYHENRQAFEAYLKKIKKFLKENDIECKFDEIVQRNDGYCECGYIDHGYELKAFVDLITSSCWRLHRYLFSDKSFILTGNDNNDHDVTFKVNYAHEAYYKGN